MSNITTSDSIIVTEIVLTQLVTQLRAAPAGLIPSREAAPPAPSAEELDMAAKVGLNVSNITTSDSIIVTEIVLTQLVTQLVTQFPVGLPSWSIF